MDKMDGYLFVGFTGAAASNTLGPGYNEKFI